jgi:hypothetical protein
MDDDYWQISPEPCSPEALEAWGKRWLIRKRFGNWWVWRPDEGQPFAIFAYRPTIEEICRRDGMFIAAQESQNDFPRFD